MNLGNLIQSGFLSEILVRRSHPLIRDGKRRSWPSISRFGLRMAKEGAREEERHHSCFVYLESLEGTRG